MRITLMDHNKTSMKKKISKLGISAEELGIYAVAV
jgi:hypothetical protein